MKCFSIDDRNALFRTLRNLIAMNRDGVCYTNLSGYNTSWVSPFEYEKQLKEKDTKSDENEKEKRFMIQGANLRGPSVHYQSSA